MAMSIWINVFKMVGQHGGFQKPALLLYIFKALILSWQEHLNLLEDVITHQSVYIYDYNIIFSIK